MHMFLLFFRQSCVWFWNVHKIQAACDQSAYTVAYEFENIAMDGVWYTMMQLQR